MKKLLFFTSLVLLTTTFLLGQIKEVSQTVNFRSTPEITENKIDTIPKGATVTIIQESTEHTDWAKINYHGKVGYVSTYFLQDVSSGSSNEVKYYKNSQGVKVQSPTHSKIVPVGATAECKDGTYSFSQSRRGTCSHHGGVKRWLE